MPYIVSKLASDQNYCFYRRQDNGVQVPDGAILIRGGAGVANKKTLVTPEGMLTEITAAQLERLQNHPNFQEHLAAGHIKILKSAPKDEGKAAADLAVDASAPLTPQSYSKKGKKAPKSAKAESGES